jgi:hypothetical protein
MRPLSVTELLDVWDHGQAQPPVQRALILLAAACPDTHTDALATLSIGRRDAHLLTLREWTFGRHMVGTATCPSCGERLELALDVETIRMASEPDRPVERTLDINGYRVQFHLPSSEDVADLAQTEDPLCARRQLLDRCIEHGEPPLPDIVLDAVAQRMAELDPQADVQLALQCPSCSHPWHDPFDIATFFWGEINAWAVRILREVHMLAAAYGWSESDILTMNARRRQVYLDMVCA